VTTESRREFASIEAAVEDIRAGQIIMVVDDEDRENEGDFLMAADRVTPEAVNFMIMHGAASCACHARERLDELQIPMMVSDNTRPSAPPSRSAWTPGAGSRPASPPMTGR